MATSNSAGFKSTKPSLDLYDQFLSNSNLDRLQKILARYELYKKTVDVPGHIVECGVYKGSGIYLFAKLLKLFAPNNDKKIYGFDFFEARAKTKLSYKVDRKVLSNHESGWESRKHILDKLSDMGANNNVELIAGDVVKTTREFAQKNVGVKIALLYLDVDTYDATLACLKNLYPLVSEGGVVIFDEYAYPEVGEAKAVDKYFGNKKINLKSLPWANTPSAYFVK